MSMHVHVCMCAHTCIYVCWLACTLVCMCERVRVIHNWGEPERAPHRRYMWAFAIYVRMLAVVRTSLRLLLRTTNIFRILSVPRVLGCILSVLGCILSECAIIALRVRDRARRAVQTAE